MINIIVKNLLRYVGVDIRRYRPGSSERAQYMKMLQKHKVNMVFDIGANIGQFGLFLREGGYKDEIVSYEPLSSARDRLLKTARKYNKWNVAPQAAIGNYEGQIEINIAGNSASSSILNMLETHINAAPVSKYIGSEKVNITKLDNLAKDYLKEDTKLFIKIDTQGYEDKVINGGKDSLLKAIGLQLELSIIELYEGQILYDEMIIRLKKLGFNLWNICPAFVDPNSGRLLQVDAIFFKE